MPRPPTPDDSLPPAQRRAAIATILALHAAAGWGLLQVQAVRDSLVTAAPLFVDLLAPPAAKPPAPPPLPPAPRPRRPPPPVPPVIAAAPPVPAPAPFVAPAPEPDPPVVAAPVPPVSPAPPAPPEPAAPPPPPPLIPPSAIRYRVLPDIEYPAASRRLREAGLVIVAVYMDADGLPREVQVVQSSGFERLDRAAAAGVRRARFQPHTKNGRPLAGWARIPVPFELEN